MRDILDDRKVGVGNSQCVARFEEEEGVGQILCGGVAEGDVVLAGAERGNFVDET